MGKPTTCNDPTCDQTHPKGCVGHVEDCTACGWRGRNYLDEPCRKCGGEVQRRPCTQHARKGMTVCNSHGGNAPQNVHAAGRREHQRLAREQAADSLAKVGVTPIGDPLDALAQIAAEAVALKDHFADLVAELEKSMAFTDRQGDQKLDARVALYERALDRSHRFLADWVRLGFEDRKVQLDEIRTARVVAFVRGVLADHGIDTGADTTRQILRTWQPVLDGDAPPA